MNIAKQVLQILERKLVHELVVFDGGNGQLANQFRASTKVVGEHDKILVVEDGGLDGDVSQAKWAPLVKKLLHRVLFSTEVLVYIPRRQVGVDIEHAEC